NLAAPEAMDAAQLARNISEDKGYTTQLIRPFSLYLLQNRGTADNPSAVTNPPPDNLARVKAGPPDISNPPVYPCLLAGLMKVLPFRYPVDLKSSFWSEND